MTSHLKRVRATLKYETSTGMLSDAGYQSGLPPVSSTPTQTLAGLAGECARLAAIDGDEEIVLTEVKAAIRRVKEWRRENEGKRL